MNYPSITFTKVTNGASIALTTFQHIQTGVKSIQQDALNARRAVSTLATMMNRAVGPGGTFVYGSHGGLAVGASQHHDRSHAAQHIPGGGDPVLTASGGGVIAASTFTKINTVETNASPLRFTAGSYTGSGGAGRLITCGFRPAYIFLGFASQVTIVFINQVEVIDGATRAFIHLMVTTAQAKRRHFRELVTHAARVTDTGFVLGSFYNVTAWFGNYLAYEGG